MEAGGNKTKTAVDWVREDSPEARGYTCGTKALSKKELISLLLDDSRGGSAMERATGLLAQVPSLRELSALSPGQLREIASLTKREALLVTAIFELASRYAEEKVKEKETITSADDAHEFLRARMRDLQHEAFCAIFLDQKHGIISFAELFRGTINCSVVHPREIVKEALRMNAAAVILAHNHPSGNTNPSREDIDLTETLEKILAELDIRLLDHLIIGGNGYYSFAREEMMPSQKEEKKEKEGEEA